MPICAYQWGAHSNETNKVEEIPRKPLTVLYGANTSSEPEVAVETMQPYSVSEVTPEELAEEEYYDDLDLLAELVMAEAEDQDLMGKRMVVDVVLNRVDDPDYPDTIGEVITQPYQFSSYWDGRIYEVDPSEDCFTAVKMELQERSYPSILYFTAGGYGEYGTPWKKYGDHYFNTK